MPKPNAMLARIKAQAELKYNALFHAKMDMLLQMGQDAALIAAHDTLQFGPGRAKAFCEAYIEAMNGMARMVVDDQADDAEFVYAKAKIDELIKTVVGTENFHPWEERYGKG